jgi:hypothetical protein
VSTPISRAVSGSCDTARIARPIRVLLTNVVNTAARTSESTMISRPVQRSGTVPPGTGISQVPATNTFGNGSAAVAPG